MPKPQERGQLQVQSERVVLAAVRLPDSTYDFHDPFGELKSLAEQAGATVVGELSQRLESPVSATYMGSGKILELKMLCETLGATTIIFDHELSPKQIGNIEKETARKVIDRSELILDIFASRATTVEAQLQVEIAQLAYTYPRLKSMWNHLERIVGGIGTRGPGEMQLEIDRRLVQKRRLALERELDVIQARKRREVAARRREHFTVGIVGYTNAGKSTLFNTLTAGGAYADDRLFATLVTRTRDWDLGGGLSTMLSDTVGFVRDIPHHLVASFKATLEEATHADLLLIVLDVSDPGAELQFKTVNSVLDELFDELKKSHHEEDRFWAPPRRVLLLNKIDRLKDNTELLVWQRKAAESIAISALPDAQGRIARGHDELVTLVRAAAQGEVSELDITLPMSDARTISIIEKQSEVVDRKYDGDQVTLRTRIGVRQLAMLKSAGARIEASTTDGKHVEIAKLRQETEKARWTATEGAAGESPRV